jgi:hypothetical protein
MCQKNNPYNKTPDARGTETGILSRERLATRLYPYARGTKVKTILSICGYVHWVGGGFSLQYRRSREVVRILITEIIPRFGLPKSLQSDFGPAFKEEVTQGLSRALDTEYHLHCAWRPQSSGKVKKQMNF